MSSETWRPFRRRSPKHKWLKGQHQLHQKAAISTMANTFLSMVSKWLTMTKDCQWQWHWIVTMLRHPEYVLTIWVASYLLMMGKAGWFSYDFCEPTHELWLWNIVPLQILSHDRRAQQPWLVTSLWTMRSFSGLRAVVGCLKDWLGRSKVKHHCLRRNRQWFRVNWWWFIGCFSILPISH